MLALPPKLPDAPAVYSVVNEQAFRTALTRYFQQQRTDAAVADPNQAPSALNGTLVKSIGGGVLGNTLVTEASGLLTVGENLRVAGTTALASTLSVGGAVTAASSATFGGPVSIGASPASTGDLRFKANSSLQFRNGANSGDVYGLGVTTGDILLLGGAGSTALVAAVNGLTWLDIDNALNTQWTAHDLTATLTGDVEIDVTRSLTVAVSRGIDLSDASAFGITVSATADIDIGAGTDGTGNLGLSGAGGISTLDLTNTRLLGSSAGDIRFVASGGTAILQMSGTTSAFTGAVTATATVQGTQLLSTVATGTAPLTVASTTLVSNLTANYLGASGQDAAFFQNSSNQNAGTLPSGRLTGAYSGITGVGTLASGAVPFSLLTPGTAGAGDYVFPANLAVTTQGTFGQVGTPSGSTRSVLANLGISIFRGAAQPVMDFFRANTSLSAPSAVGNNDVLGTFQFGGWDGSAYNTGPSYAATAKSTWSGTNREAQLEFRTVANGSTAATLRWIMQSAGHFIPNSDNTLDLGGTGNRLQSGYFGTNLSVGGNFLAGTTPANPAAQNYAQWDNTAGTFATLGVSWSQYRYGGGAQWTGNYAGGTSGAPTVPPASAVMLQIAATGWDSGTGNFGASTRARFQLTAAENWISGSAEGTSAKLLLTRPTTQTTSEVLRWGTGPWDALSSTTGGRAVDQTLLIDQFGTQGSGNYGPSLGFTGIANSGRRYAALVLRQTTSDPDQNGLSLWVHNSATNTDPMVELARFSRAGDLDTELFGGLFLSGQINSSVATGTAPFVVASTTLVANLHAASADTGTTQSAADNSTKLATTAYVDRAPASVTATSAAPSGTTSATAVMMGLGATATITPVKSGRVLFTVSGQVANNTAGDGATLDLRTGTGTAPTNGAAVTGTLRGLAQTVTSVSAAQKSGFTVSAVVTGLTLNTAVWFDLSLLRVTGGTATLTGITATALEFD